jgi:hypothetical protein
MGGGGAEEIRTPIDVWSETLKRGTQGRSVDVNSVRPVNRLKNEK